VRIFSNIQFTLSDISNRFLSPPFFGVPGPGPQEGQGGNISGQMMAQYLMALLGHRDPALFGMPENGRMGDYVFNQEGI
jgi:E3 ubiquitin-protein ligase RNF115/126